MSPAILQYFFEVMIGLGGILLVLMGTGRLSRYPNDPSKNQQLVAKWGKTLLILGILMVISGLSAVPRLLRAI